MFATLNQWIVENGALLTLLSSLSIVGIVASIVLAPLIVARIPADYFLTKKRISPVKERLTLLYWIIFVVKNLFGVLFILLGLIMFITPGPGFVFLIIGLILTNYPGKYRTERWLVRRPHVLSSLNWMRKKNGKPPLEI